MPVSFWMNGVGQLDSGCKFVVKVVRCTLRVIRSSSEYLTVGTSSYSWHMSLNACL